MSVLEMADVYRRFPGGKTALRGVDLKAEQGEVIGLVGANGAGKTTLLRVALGLLEPDNGSVLVFGDNPRARPVEVKRRLGYVAELPTFPTHIVIQDLLEMHASLFPTWDWELQHSLFERFELSSTAQLSTLSKGGARRVALVCAIAHHPELLLLDEPASGLDPAARRQFLEVAIEYLNSAGGTILFSSHHMQDVERIAGRVVLMSRGRIMLDEPLDELGQNYALALFEADDFSAGRVRDLETCVHLSKQRQGGFKAVLSEAPDRARSRVALALGDRDVVHCVHPPLEELFVSLQGELF